MLGNTEHEWGGSSSQLEIDCKWITQMPTQIPTVPLPFTGLTIFVNSKDQNWHSKLDLCPVSPRKFTALIPIHQLWTFSHAKFMNRHSFESAKCGKINTNFERCAISKAAFRKFHHFILNHPPEAQKPQLGISLPIWCGKAPSLSPASILGPQNLFLSFRLLAPKSHFLLFLQPQILFSFSSLSLVFVVSLSPSLLWETAVWTS